METKVEIRNQLEKRVSGFFLVMQYHIWIAIGLSKPYPVLISLDNRHFTVLKTEFKSI